MSIFYKIRSEKGEETLGDILKFRLVYEGQLLGCNPGKSRAFHKHEI